MNPVTAFISVGSNIDPEIHVPDALKRLIRTISVTGISTHYRTIPLKRREKQDNYLNGVWRVEVRREPSELKNLLKRIEAGSGRRRSGDSFEARTLDLDLLIWGDLADPSAGVPDPDVLLRPFLYLPILEIEPDLIWPLTKTPLKTLVPAAYSGTMDADKAMTELLKGLLNG
jgi:2-amino-4-hydroxy-6-hydroxymethyldihydropteridine diphosphokinase